MFSNARCLYEVSSVLVDGELRTFYVKCCRPELKNVKVKRNGLKWIKVERTEPKRWYRQFEKLIQTLQICHFSLLFCPDNL